MTQQTTVINFHQDPKQKLWRGDTFPGFKIYIVWGGEIPDFDQAVIQMQIRQGGKRGKVVYEADLNEGMEVTDAGAGEVTIQPFDMDWKPTDHFYDIEMTYNDFKQTFFEGIFKLSDDTTRWQ